MFGTDPRYNPDLEDAHTCADCDAPINDDRVYCAACEQAWAEAAEPAYDGGGRSQQAEQMDRAYQVDRSQR